MSLSGIIHHSHSFTRLEIYHHFYFKGKLVRGAKRGKTRNWYQTRENLYAVLSVGKRVSRMPNHEGVPDWSNQRSACFFFLLGYNAVSSTRRGTIS